MRKTAINSVYTLAQQDEKVLFIGSDLSPDVLVDMKKNMPDRYFMEGVSEQHIVGMAAGLAMEGFKPYVNTIATFLTRRCYEQVVLDLCLQDLPVRLIANGGGLVYAPLGPTHLAVEDFAILRALPNMAIVAPSDADEMKRLMMASLNYPHPLYIRLGKGGDQVVSKEENGFEIGKGIVLKKPVTATFITTGVMTQIALQACEELSKEGIECGVLHLHTVKPLDGELLSKWIPQVEAVVTVEEHMRMGGFGSAILEYCSDVMPDEVVKLARLGIPDEFAIQYGSQNSLLQYWGITPTTLVETMKKKLKR